VQVAAPLSAAQRGRRIAGGSGLPILSGYGLAGNDRGNGASL